MAAHSRRILVRLGLCTALFLVVHLQRQHLFVPTGAWFWWVWAAAMVAIVVWGIVTDPGRQSQTHGRGRTP